MPCLPIQMLNKARALFSEFYGILDISLNGAIGIVSEVPASLEYIKTKRDRLLGVHVNPFSLTDVISVVHEPSRLEPARVSWHPALGGSNRGLRADSSPLAARVGSERGPRADSTPDSSLLARSWRILGGSSLARVLESRCHLGSSPRAQGGHEPSRLEPRAGLGSSRLVNNTISGSSKSPTISTP